MEENEARAEVFRGYLEECLRHLGASLEAKAPKHSRLGPRLRKPMSEFCGVAPKSIVRWLYTDSGPKGEQLIKAMFFLDLIGYRVMELEKMTKVRRPFAEVIGFGLLSSEEARVLLGYSKVSSLYQVLLGREDANSTKTQKMWDLWKERRAELDKKKQKIRQRYQVGEAKHKLPSFVSVAQPLFPEVVKETSNYSFAAIKLMEALLLILEGVELNNLAESDLHCFQRLAARVIGRSSIYLGTGSSQLSVSDRGDKERKEELDVG